MKKFNTLIVALFIFSISSKAEQTVGTFENADFGKNFTHPSVLKKTMN